MIDKAVDSFSGVLRSGLHLAAHHWILVLIGIGFAILFSPFLLRVFYTDLGYVLWLATGSLGQILRSAGKESTWEYLGLANPYAVAVESRGRFVASLNMFPGQTEGSKYIRLGESVGLIPLNSPYAACAMANPTMSTVEVEVQKFFPVNPRRIRRGCHGRYSLAKSIYLNRTFGGDPKCGGGLKYLTSPLWQQILELLRLKKLLKQKTVPAFVLESSSGSSGAFYEETFDEKIPMGYLIFFVGDERMIRQHAKRRQIPIKPIQLVFA